MKADQYDSLLISIIMAKLPPPDIRVHVAQNTTQDVWNIKSILNIIQKEIDVREISEKVKAMATTTEPKQPPPGPKNSTMGTFLGNKPPLQMPTFVYCAEMHFSALHDRVTDKNAQKAILK